MTAARLWDKFGVERDLGEAEEVAKGVGGKMGQEIEYLAKIKLRKSMDDVMESDQAYSYGRG